jgi:hypothetical protein
MVFPEPTGPPMPMRGGRVMKKSRGVAEKKPEEKRLRFLRFFLLMSLVSSMDKKSVPPRK